MNMTSMTRILLIEDNTEVRENIVEILELSQYEVLAAENGKVGVKLAQSGNPDLIICDIMMPEMDGYGVLHALSKNDSTAAIPFIFLTAKADRADLRKGMEMGADDYITKPFDDIELLNAVEARLKKSALYKAEVPPTAEGVNEFLRNAGKGAAVNSDDYETQEYKKKQTVYQQGKRPLYLYFVAKGKIKTFKINDDGKELITDIYKEGDFLGYTTLLEDTAYLDTGEALEDTQVLMIPKAEFLDIIARDRIVAHKFIKLLAQNLIEKEEQLLNLAYNSLRKRIANGLLQVNEKFKSNDNDRPKLEISREALAQVVGTATESLIRVLSDFKSEKLIEIVEGKIYVLEERKLKELLN
jgi:CRP/FNR family transcriptional regulator, cyclic AMP receptor protein